MQSCQLSRKRSPSWAVRVFERLADRLDLISHARQPSREHVQEHRNAGQQEHRRQRHLNHMRDLVEC
jgi:hypothetical protein